MKSIEEEIFEILHCPPDACERALIHDGLYLILHSRAYEYQRNKKKQNNHNNDGECCERLFFQNFKQIFVNWVEKIGKNTRRHYRREERINNFIENDVPFDSIGVGSSLLKNPVDFTADIVATEKDGRLFHCGKVGRPIPKDLSRLEKVI